MKERDFTEALNKVKISPGAEERVLKRTINYNHEKENAKMLKRKFAVIAVAAVLALSITAFAASGVITTHMGSSSSSLNAEYKSFPSIEQCEKDIGYSPVLIDSFENGYKFKTDSIVKNDFADESGASVEKFKSVMFRYEKDDDEVLLSADKYDSEIDLTGDIINSVNGIDLYYTSYNNKYVPDDYKLTGEDKEAQEKGDLVFSYGTSNVSVSTVQNLSWEYNGIQYSLTQIDGKLTQQQLVDMAAEIISE